MERRMFKAVCPLEVGDLVAIARSGDRKVAYYIPEGMMLEINGEVAVQRVTDIMTQHYFKSGRVKFLYELNGSGNYEDLMVKIPIRQMADELERQGR